MGALSGKGSTLVERIIDYMAPEDMEPEEKGALGKGKKKSEAETKRDIGMAGLLGMKPGLATAILMSQPGFEKGLTDPLPDNAVPGFAKGLQTRLKAPEGSWRDEAANRIEAEPREGEAFARLLTAPFSGALRDPVRTVSEVTGYAPLSRAADAFSETQGAPDVPYAAGRMVRGAGEGALGAATVAGNVYGAGQAAKATGGALARAYRGGPAAELPAADSLGALRSRVAKADASGGDQLQGMIDEAGARAAAAESKIKPVDWSQVDMPEPTRYFAGAADGVEGAPWRGSAQDISRLVRMQDAGDFAVTEIPFAEMNATQTEIRPAFASVARRYGDGVDDLPVAVRYQGKIYVVDGHHRLATKAEGGANAAQVRLFDMDKGAPAPPAPRDWTINIEGRTAPGRPMPSPRSEPDAYTPFEFTPEEQAAIDLSRANQGRISMWDQPSLSPSPRRGALNIDPAEKAAMNAEIERLANEAEAAGQAGDAGAVAKAHEDIASIMARTGKPLESSPRLQAIQDRIDAIDRELKTADGAWREEELLAEAEDLMNERRTLRGKAPRQGALPESASPTILGSNGGNLGGRWGAPRTRPIRDYIIEAADETPYAEIADDNLKMPDSIKVMISRERGRIRARLNDGESLEGVSRDYGVTPDVMEKFLSPKRRGQVGKLTPEIERLAKVKDDLGNPLGNTEITKRLRNMGFENVTPNDVSKITSRLRSRGLDLPHRRMGHPKTAEITRTAGALAFPAGMAYLQGRIASDILADQQDEGALPAFMLEQGAPQHRSGALSR